MEIGGMDVKEPQVQVPWIPTTPVKPVVPKSLPICTPGEKTQMGLHANAEVACSELSLGQDGSVLAATMGKIGGDNGNFFEQTASNTVLNCSNLSFSEHLLVAEAASANSIDGLKNPVISSTIHDNSCDPRGTSHVGCCSKRPSQDTPLTPGDAIKADSRQIAPMQINMEEKDSGGEETNDPARKLDNNGIPPNKELIDPVMEVAAVSSPFKENHNTDSVVSQQTDMNKTPQQKTRRRKHRPKVVVEGKPKRARKPATRKTDQSKENPTGKRKYVRKNGLNKTSSATTEVTGELTAEMSKSNKTSCKKSLDFDLGAQDESSAGVGNAAALVGKENVLAVQDKNVSLANDLNTSMMPPSSVAGDTQAPNASPSRRNSLGTKPKENQAVKRKYVRRKTLNKNSTPSNEVTVDLTEEKMPETAKTSSRRSLNFDKGVVDVKSADEENAGLHLGNEIGVVVQEMNVDLAHDPKISMEQVSFTYVSLPNDAQAPSTSPSKNDPPGTTTTEKSTGKRKYVRRKGSSKSPHPIPPAETAELAEKVMPESNKMSLSSSLNFDLRTRDESSAYGENLDVHTGQANGVVVEQKHVSLSHNEDSGMKQALNDYIALPEDTQAPNTSSKSNPPGAKLTGNLTGKRKYVRRKGSNKTSTPADMTGELTEAMVLESARISSKTLNFDKSARDESNACRENLVHDQNTLGKQVLCSYMSLPEDLQPLSASISKSNPLGEKKNKRKGQATAKDGNISNDQIPAIRSQMVGSKRKHSGTVECAANSSMNLIGAHYNGFLSYETQFWVQFPNIQKKRRTEKGRTSDTNATSVITNKVQLTCTQEYAKALPYASSSSCWIYDSAYNAARGPGISESTENVVGNTGTFEEFVLSLRRITEASQFPAQNCSYTPLNIFRNYYAEQNYAAKQLGIFDIQTFGGAERPETSTAPLGAETHASLAKKNQKRKRSSRSRSRSPHPSTNEMQQYYNFALGNYLLPSPKSLDFACGVICQTLLYVEALAEQFRQLNINTEARALVPYNQQIQKQNSLANGDGTIIPFQGAFDPIKKQHPRPKVDLDEETDRVWKLLMLDINSHGIDGDDEVKAKWWEEERNVFRGRADSFIARMHLVQGDRRFSRWKGSVVDSVVGVFLTQNVSDHLSSSAYMSLAARFPLKTSRMCKTYQGEGTSLVVNEPQVHIVEPEEHTEWDVKLLNQSVHDQSSMTIDIVEHSGEKEAVNSNDSCRATSTVISLTDESNCTLSESSERNIKEHHSPMRSGLNNAIIEEGEDKPCYDGVRKDLNDIVSSQCSVISSQISGDLSNDQNPEKMGSCSDSNSEVEDLSTTEKYNQFSSSTSFVKLLEMVSSPKLYEVHPQEQSKHVQQGFSNISVQARDLMQKERGLDLGDHKDAVRSETNEITSAPKKVKNKGQAKEKKEDFNWDSLRVEAQAKAGKREKTENTLDSLDWDAVRCADVSEISNAIKERGMNNRLAERIQNFLNRLVEEHGEIDLEWLRDVPPDQAKEYLLSIRGLGLKSVECVRLLTLHHLAFPVDTNVGRIAVRLGWVPLQPLPESVQLHLLELYPVLESIQKYLWPRLCKLDQRTLYELHYQMITFGKVFCTKSKPNCNACPMRAECRHFASAFASARLALPGPEQRSIVVSTDGNRVTDQNPSVIINQLHLPLPEHTNQAEESQQTEVSKQLEQKSEKQICLPIVEEPMSPEPEISHVSLNDIEDSFCDDPNEIPTINLNMEEFTLNLQNYMQANMELQEGEMSKALVALNPETASIPMPKLKNVSRLRTEHCVYELPDTHPLLEGWDLREPDDPGKYLLAIWTPGETADSIQPPESKCSSQEESGRLCNEKECFSCNSFREANSQIVRGTLLIPCRTAMRGSFPLNGTYFQVNEVFADHGSSLEPISVPRSWIWNLNRRTVYFGTSVPAIFKGLSTPEIQQCFWRGYVCVRGFDRETRGPRPLIARLHFPASKMAAKVKEVTKKEPAKEKTRKQSKKKGSSSANSQGSNPNPDHPELVSNGHNLQEKGKA